ncbi:MAG: tetratricopeptide repeat protein [Planctomycetaceae bacterium]
MTPLRILLLVAFFAPHLRAQEEDLPPDEAEDLAAMYVGRGEESLRQGNYDEARLRFQKALRRDAGNRAARLGIVAAHRAQGAYGPAETVLQEMLGTQAGDREATLALAELEFLRGRTTSARDLARAVVDKGVEGPDLTGLAARSLLAAALASAGKREEARGVLDFFLTYYEGRYAALAKAAEESEALRADPRQARPLAAEMTLVARALRQYVELSPLDYDFANNAKELLDFAKERLDPELWEAWIESVRVTRLERQRAIVGARRALRFMENRNPELADLYVEVAKSLLIGFGNEAEARRLAETALRVHPAQTEARAIVAQIALEDNEYDVADEQLSQGLATNPRHRSLLALKATLALLVSGEAAFEKGMQEVLAIDPTFGEGYYLAGLVVASRQRRYDRAAQFLRKAVDLDPAHFEAHAALGIFLANLGRAEEARDALAKSQALFPLSHPMRDNFKQVLEYVTGTLTDLRTEHFVVRMDPSEHAILGAYLPQLLEECWADMTKRYGFVPEIPVLVEVFRKADDFSVRTIGLPGIPALGACFGGLITLDSPQALPPGQFLWASTARHEFAHVISLQLSGGQVPRWFTEGLSVLEEAPLDTGWGLDEDFERMVFDAYHTASLPPIARFDALFRTGQVAYAYHVGGLMLAFLKERSGEEGIVKALRLYGRDRPMREVFENSFDLKLEEFDRLFREYVGARIAAYRRVPDYRGVLPALRQAALQDATDGATLLKIAWAYFQAGQNVDAGVWLDRAAAQLPPGDTGSMLLRALLYLRSERRDRARPLLEKFFEAGGEDFDARLVMASFAAQDQEGEAYEAHLKKAKECFPPRVGPQSPYTLLQQFYAAQARPDDALREMEEHARFASTNLGLRLQLDAEYRRRGRNEDAIRVLEEALRITLFHPQIHQSLVSLYREAGRPQDALRSARCRVRLLPDEAPVEMRVDLWLDLAEVAKEAGQREEALKALEEATQQAADRAEEFPRIGEVKKQLEGP